MDHSKEIARAGLMAGLSRHRRSAAVAHLARALSQAPIAVDKPAAPKTPTDQKAQYVDELAVENSKLDSKMKTICRGC
jgi:hypothetical protein